ncbi:MAG: hypothetical protein LZ168_00040 [Thaumarchaeota archaeon]|jgi:hypothetical protein|nr:hypothetical protein [Candidatus Geocrenenecus arthurdayi]
MRNLKNNNSSTWRGTLSVRNRLILIIIITVSLYSLLYIASTIPLSADEITSLMEEAEKILREKYTIMDIFLNNFMISLLMFIPLAGPFIGGYAIYFTGRLIGALSVSTGVPSILLISMTIITFYGFIEFLAYGTAFTESIVFTYSIFKKKSRIESRWLIISIAAVAILLLIAATIEYMLIQFFGQIYPNLEELPAKI